MIYSQGLVARVNFSKVILNKNTSFDYNSFVYFLTVAFFFLYCVNIYMITCNKIEKLLSHKSLLLIFLSLQKTKISNDLRVGIVVMVVFNLKYLLSQFPFIKSTKNNKNKLHLTSKKKKNLNSRSLKCLSVDLVEIHSFRL